MVVGLGDIGICKEPGIGHKEERLSRYTNVCKCKTVFVSTAAAVRRNRITAQGKVNLG
jgi:hypothetical protein